MKDPTHVVLKLITGELILARILNKTEEGNNWVIEHPMIVNVLINEEGRSKLYLSPYNPLCSKQVIMDLKDKDVIWTDTQPDDEYVIYYEINVMKRYGNKVSSGLFANPLENFEVSANTAMN